jgi:hypothetical protein
MLRLLVTTNVVPRTLILSTLMMDVIHSPKCSFLQEPHGVTSQKAAFFIVTAMKPQILIILLPEYVCREREAAQ